MLSQRMVGRAARKVRIAALLAGAPAVLALTVLGGAGPASAGPAVAGLHAASLQASAQPARRHPARRHSARRLSARPHTRPAPARAVELRTLAARVHVRTGPKFSFRVRATIRTRGTALTVSCYVYGSRIAGNTVWYRLSRPVTGYVTSYYMDSHYDPVRGVSRCKTAQFSRNYRIVVRGVHIRFWPSAFAARLATLGRVGSEVAVNCYSYGESIRGDRIWYHITRPVSGFVSGTHLNTGRDPAPGIPACW
jgi:hypothetical protein